MDKTVAGEGNGPTLYSYTPSPIKAPRGHGV